MNCIRTITYKPEREKLLVLRRNMHRGERNMMCMANLKISEASCTLMTCTLVITCKSHQQAWHVHVHNKKKERKVKKTEWNSSPNHSTSHNWLPHTSDPILSRTSTTFERDWNLSIDILDLPSLWLLCQPPDKSGLEYLELWVSERKCWPFSTAAASCLRWEEFISARRVGIALRE